MKKDKDNLTYWIESQLKDSINVIEKLREHYSNNIYDIADLIYSHINLASSERESLRMATVVREKRDDWAYTDIDVLGPTPAYPARLRGSYRWHLILKGPDPRMLLDKITIPPGWVVDVDPVSLT